MHRPVKLVIAILVWAAAAGANAETAAWITKSNQDADILLEVQAKYVPEGSSGLGAESYDAQVLDLKPGVVSRESADMRGAELQYEQLLKAETDPRVRDDLEILLKATRDQRTSLELNDRLMLPYFDLPQAIYAGFRQLLDKRTAATRYPAALVRLKRYVGAEP